MPCEMKENVHLGHRSRMRAKLLTHGQAIFDTYELLEMLLYHVIPCRDTNPIAKRLLSTFGSLSGVLGAEPSKLLSVKEVGERCSRLLSLVGRAEALREMDSDISSKRYDNCADAGKFFVEYFSHHTEENILVMLLDNSLRLLRAVHVPGKSFSSGAVRISSFVSAALAAGASSAIIGYTHRGTVAFPHDGDMVTGAAVREALGAVGVNLLDILVVGDRDFYALQTKSVYRPRVTYKDDTSSVRLSSGVTVDLVYRESSGGGLLSGYLAELLSFALGDRAEEVAERLAAAYGNLDTLMSVDAEEMMSVDGMTESAAILIKLTAYVTSRRGAELLRVGRKYTDSELVTYLDSAFLGESVEKVLLIGFDGERRVCHFGTVGEGTVNRSDVLPRRIAEVAVKRGAVSVIVAHNHPRGSAEPSEDDVAAGEWLFTVLRASGIRLLSNLIFSGGRVCVIKPDPVDGKVKGFEIFSVWDKDLSQNL